MSGEGLDGWRPSTVGEIADILDSKRVPLNSEERRARSGPFPYWGANGIVDHIDDYIFDEPLVLMAEDGGYFDQAATRPICHRLDGKAWVNNHAHIIRPTGADRDYFYFWFVHRDITPFIKGGTRSKLNQAELKRLPISLPPLDEQRRIAEVLRSVDEAIATKQETLSATKQFKRSCRAAAVQRFQDCEAIRLEEVLTSVDAGWSPDCESEPANDGEWSILKTSSVVWEGYDDSENKRLPAHLEPRPRLEVAANDILITRAGPAERTGVVAIVRETAGRRMLSDKIIRLRASPERAVPLAIAELLSSSDVQAELVRAKSGMAASQTNISQKIILGLELHLPSLADQEAFADEMAALQDAIEMGEADLRDAQRLKLALLSDLLSGRVRVPA